MPLPAHIQQLLDHPISSPPLSFINYNDLAYLRHAPDIASLGECELSPDWPTWEEEVHEHLWPLYPALLDPEDTWLSAKLFELWSEGVAADDATELVLAYAEEQS